MFVKQRTVAREINPEKAKEIDIVLKRVLDVNNTVTIPEVLDDIDGEIRYANGVKRKPAIHIGQRKLMLGEIQYLLKHTKSKLDSVSYRVVYAGAAPSMHLGVLIKMFPNLKILLIDPNEFLIKFDNKTHYETDDVVYFKAEKLNMYKLKTRKINYFDGKSVQKVNVAKLPMVDWKKAIDYMETSSKKIFIYQGYMTNEIAEMFTGWHLWSDIRTLSSGKVPGDSDIIWNLAQQFVWMMKMDPPSAMLKFRMPFFIEKRLSFHSTAIKQVKEAKNYGIDFISEYKNGKLKYPGGKVLLQIWPGSNSAETRLYTNSKEDMVEWDDIKYEGKLFYWNNIQRPFLYHENKRSNKKYGFDHCGDCALECAIWDEYEEKYEECPKWLEIIGKATKHLCFGGHGELFHKLKFSEIEDLHKKSLYYDPNEKFD